MKTLAEKQKELAGQCPLAWTISGGYGIDNNLNRVSFTDKIGEIPKEIKSNTNKEGRCTHAIWEFSDKSQLTFRYYTDRPSSLVVNKLH